MTAEAEFAVINVIITIRTNPQAIDCQCTRLLLDVYVRS